MHNRVGPLVASRDLRLADTVPLVAIVLLILALAFYPQFGLRRSQSTVRAVVTPVAALSHNPYGKLAAHGWTAYAPLASR